MNNPQPILFLDSGIGGLNILREVHTIAPNFRFVYLVDNKGFPYGRWKEDLLKNHLHVLISKAIKKYNPSLCILVCNTASTLALHSLRMNFHIPIVGTVPAIKPAAKKTLSGIFSVLATPMTIRCHYMKTLIESYAKNCIVNLVESKKLAFFSENYVKGNSISIEDIAKEIEPCFIEKTGKKTDIVVLACTHYSFLINLFRNFAPWPVDWLDPSVSIAQQVRSIIISNNFNNFHEIIDDVVCFTEFPIDLLTNRLFQRFGLRNDGLI